MFQMDQYPDQAVLEVAVEVFPFLVHLHPVVVELFQIGRVPRRVPEGKEKIDSPGGILVIGLGDPLLQHGHSHGDTGPGGLVGREVDHGLAEVYHLSPVYLDLLLYLKTPLPFHKVYGSTLWLVRMVLTFSRVSSTWCRDM